MLQLVASASTVMESIKNFFEQVFVEFAELWFWPIIVLGLMLLAIFTIALLVGFSYENRILKSINKINAYFLTKPFITEENLVEFNLKMKKVPKVLRNNWQIYMLNREDAPTTYINVNSCIDKPLRTSSIEKNLGNWTVFTVFLVLLSFIIGLQYSKSVLSLTNAGDIIFFASLIPLGIVFLYTFFVLIFKAAKNDIYSLLYDNFPLYERNLTKAVSTLPAYVDYEILFTKKEIKEGIPILQQYLEKRALVEQQELEKARANSAACEEYDFAELGIDGSLVLERAMKESETFIRTRTRLQEECGQIETEKENYKKNFETTSKDYQRKLQASRENLESLKSQQEASTNRIESNYIRKQQSDEIKKQQQLEKDNEEAAAKFNEEQISLQQEIDKRQQEIEEKKAFVQQAMMLEFKHYANTLYKALTQKATEIGNQKLITLAQENADLKALLTDMQGVPVDQTQLDPQNNVIQQADVTTDKLYDMTSSDEAQMQENRETSEEMSKEEFAKEQANKEAKAKLEAEQNSQNTENVTNDAPLITEEESVVQENSTDTVDAGSDEGSNDNSNNTDVGGDTNVDTTTDDGGQQMTAEESQPQQQEEDLNEIQRQIEEENNKLQQQKQELENDLNTTISKMDNTQQDTPAQVDEGVVQEEPVVQPAPQPTEQPVVQEEPVAEPVVQPEPVVEPEPVAQPEPVVEQLVQPEPVANQQQPANEAEEVETERRTSRKPAGRATRTARASRGDSAKRATSEIDALNAEMQKLLDSTKK